MKVVFAHTDFRIYWPARLNTLNTFLQNKGIDLEVIEIAGEGSPYNFAGISNNSPFWHYLFADKRMEEIPAGVANKALREKLDELNPDIVFSGAIAFPSGAASVRWATENVRKVIVFDNARLHDVPRKWHIDFIKKRVYSFVDAILCPAPEWNETFRYFGFYDKQIFYGLNAVDNSFWAENHGSRTTNLPKRYLLTAGRQVPKKNFLYLLKAYKKYVSQTPDPAELILIGNGPKRKILEEFSKKNDISLIRFMPFLSQEELRVVYHKALFFILPSKFGETWGNVVNEAMASGLPVLVSDQVGCASTLVKPGINGFTFSSNDEEELANLLLKVTSIEEKERVGMGLKSQEIISEWGLERFCEGVGEAISYVSGRDKKIYDKRPAILPEKEMA